MATAKKLPSGNYRVNAYIGMKEGKRQYKSFTAGTKKEAELLAAEYLNGTQKEKEELLFKDAVEKYLTLKSNVLSPSTLRSYRSYKKNAYSDINDLDLYKIDLEILQDWVNNYSKNHHPKSVSNAYGFITAIFGEFDPKTSFKVTLPQKKKHIVRVPTNIEVTSVINYFKGTNDVDMLVAVYLAAFGTLRRSEVCAIRASDVCGDIIHVHKAMVQNSNKEYVIKTPKNVSSDRYIPMPHYVIQSFPKTGRLVNLNPNVVSHRLKAALKYMRAKQFTFHDLRHYAASVMHAIGIPDQYIMQRGGWSTDGTLKEIYRGVIEDYETAYNDKLMNHFENMQHEMQHEKIKPL